MAGQPVVVRPGGGHVDFDVGCSDNFAINHFDFTFEIFEPAIMAAGDFRSNELDF
jgi:hypothetical protein